MICYTSLNKIKELFGTHTTVKIAASGPKQEGSMDRGLFAVTCVSLAYGKQPPKYLQRTHLINCIKQYSSTV